MDRNIDRFACDTKIFHFNDRHSGWQEGPHGHAPPRCIHIQPKYALDNQEHTRGRPGLWAARDRVLCRHGEVATVSGETAVDLWKAVTRESDRGVDYFAGKDCSLVVESGSFEACDDDRVVVWPDTAVVITHRIEVGLMTTKCPDPPPTAQIFRHYASHHGGTKLLWDDAAPNVVGRIGADGMYLLLIWAQCHGKI